jgi:hypothetical protein
LVIKTRWRVVPKGPDTIILTTGTGKWRAVLSAGALSCVVFGAVEAQNLGNLRGQIEEETLLRRNGSEIVQRAPEGMPAPSYEPVSRGAVVEDVPVVEDLGLEELDLNTTATARANSAEILESEIPSPAVRAPAVQPIGPVQTGSIESDGDDPYGATGIEAGSFILRPSLEIGLTGSRDRTAFQSGTPPVVSNATSNTLFGDGSLRLQANSDWSRHELAVNAFGRLQRSLDNETYEPEIGINMSGRVDITGSTTLSSTLNYGYELETPRSAAYLAATDSAIVPAVFGTGDIATQTLGGSATLRQEFGRLFGEAGISAERSIYDDAELNTGALISQSDLDNTVYEGRLRAGFELSPVFSPFVEVGYGIRRTSTALDSAGLDRDSKRYVIRAGTELDFGEKLNGEISAGFVREDIVDVALEDISGVTVDAALNWSPRRGTDVDFSLSTTTETSGAVGESGAILYAAGLGVTHRLRSNLTLDVDTGLEYRDARGGGDETTWDAQASVTYWFNRFAGLTTRIRHEQTVSSDPLLRSRTSTAFVGLRLQR